MTQHGISIYARREEIIYFGLEFGSENNPDPKIPQSRMDEFEQMLTKHTKTLKKFIERCCRWKRTDEFKVLFFWESVRPKISHMV